MELTSLSWPAVSMEQTHCHMTMEWLEPCRPSTDRTSRYKETPKRHCLSRRLSHNTTEEQVKELFAVYGKIERCKLIRDIVTGRSKGYAFVEFKHRRDAESAFLKAHKAFINDVQILVEYECERALAGWTPRRFGGGFGGKKESGQLRFGGRDRPFRKPIMLNSRPLGREGSLRERGQH
ncbi:hypothetical protein EMCRGX_G021253 [Ephydatia muelleri]